MSAKDGAHYLLPIHPLFAPMVKDIDDFFVHVILSFCNFVALFLYSQFLLKVYIRCINFQTSIRRSVDNDVDKD